MKQGFVKVAAVTPDIRVADVEFNKEQICRKMDEAAASGAKIIVFPELCVICLHRMYFWIMQERF